MRLDTTSLRGVFQQQIHGSKRSLRSVEDFTEFEQRTAYFNGDPIHAAKKGLMILDRVQVSHMAQMQNMFDFPPAPKLTPQGRLDPAKATESERRGEQVFFGKGQCATCHTPPFYLDHQMHDLMMVVNRPDQDIDTLQGAKEPFHQGQIFITRARYPPRTDARRAHWSDDVRSIQSMTSLDRLQARRA